MFKNNGLKPQGGLSDQEQKARLINYFEPGCFYL